MSSGPAPAQDLAAEWRAARRIYPVYVAVLKRFDPAAPGCKELDSPVDRTDADSIAAVRQWLAAMDERVEASQLRQILQSLPVGTEENLRALLRRYLSVEDGIDRFREKIDFLLVQYFSHCAPPEMLSRAVRLEDFAKVLEPVIGEATLRVPPFMGGLEMLLVRLSQCETLADLLREGILQQGRAIKDQAGPMYFTSGAMLAFTRFNFLVRRRFMTVLQKELKVVTQAFDELEARGLESVDCSGTDFERQESIKDLRRICREWRNIYRSDYRTGNGFEVLADIRRVVDRALVASAKLPKKQFVAVEEPLGPEDRFEEPEAEILRSLGGKSVPAVNVRAAQESIAESVRTRGLASMHLPVSTVRFGEAKVLLASWEVAAFVASDERSFLLQRSVAMRGLLADCLQRHKAAPDEKLIRAVLSVAQSEAATLQEEIARARDRKQVDAAVNLAATAQRLLSVMGEAEKMLGRGSAGERRN